jgi:hypothetical protein
VSPIIRITVHPPGHHMRLPSRNLLVTTWTTIGFVPCTTGQRPDQPIPVGSGFDGLSDEANRLLIVTATTSGLPPTAILTRTHIFENTG